MRTKHKEAVTSGFKRRWMVSTALAVCAIAGLLATRTTAAGTPASLAQWSAPVSLPSVPVGASVLASGKVLFWASNQTNNFTLNGNTHTALFDPATNTAVARNVTATAHNMFCPGTCRLSDGRLLVNGGFDAGKTSIYNPATDTWAAGPAMNVARGYNGSTPLGDGSVLTLGGTWSGVSGQNRTAEIYTEAGGWKLLPGVPDSTAFMIDGVNRGWQSGAHYSLIPTGNGKVLLAGPAPNMYWIDTKGNGSYAPAGRRGDDGPAFSGLTVMYDAGKILKAGGSTWNTGGMASSATAYIIDTTNGAADVTRLPNMAYARGHANAVVLPGGQVLMIGGQTSMEEFSDAYAVLAPELFDPATKTFTVLPPMSVARNYHSIAVLLADGRVLAGGGGLCACPADHANLEILSPPYLFNPDGSRATRPVITSAPTQVNYGAIASVTTDSAVTGFSLVRLNAVTHSVNNDQRRVSLNFTASDATHYSVSIPTNQGILLPGQWMLFATNANGTPSVAAIVTVRGAGTPVLTNPGDLSAVVGSAVNIPLSVSNPSGTLSMSAVRLPAGLTINSSTGAITGTPTAAGRSLVTLVASNGTQTVSTEVVFNVTAATTSVTNSPLFGYPSVGTAFTDSYVSGQVLTGAALRVGRQVYALQGLATPANLAYHGSMTSGTATTANWGTADPIVRIFGSYSSNVISQISFATRSGRIFGPYARNTTGGTISSFNFSAPAGSQIVGFTGTADTSLRSIGVRYVASAPIVYRQPVISAISSQQGAVGVPVSLAALATDPDGNPLDYTATGLPAGLAINASTGVISGTPAAAGTSNVTVTAANAGGLSASTSFSWVITANVPRVTSLAAPVVNSGVTANFAPTLSSSEPATFTWNFGDGSAAVSGGSASTTHTFAQPGVYPVSLTIATADGRTSNYTFLQAVIAPGANAPSAARSSSNVLTTASQLWVVNQDNDSVSVFDAATNARLAEITVGKAPRTLAQGADGRIWVVNKASNSISIINPSTRAIVQTVTLARASQPFGIVISPLDGSAFVTLEATGQLLKLNGATGATAASLAVGTNPRHLAINSAGTQVLVSRFITRLLPGEHTQTLGAPGNSGGEVLTINAASLTQTGVITLAMSTLPDGSNTGSGVPNYLGAPAISPDGKTAWIPSKQDNVGRGRLRNGVDLDFKHTVRSITSRIDLVSGIEDLGGRVDHNLSSLASAALQHPNSAYLFVALEGNREVAVVDAARKTELFRYSVGLAPEGLTLSANGQKLYVNNFMSRNVSVIDLTALLTQGQNTPPAAVSLASIATEKLAANVLKGKQLFYDAADPRLSQQSYMSCAVCHNDGGHDGRVWDFTGVGEGLRNTTSLRGRSGTGQGFLHWSANFDEIQDFEAQIRGFAGGTGLMTDAQFNTGTRNQPLGDPKAGVSPDLDALAAYVTSLSAFDPSPFRNADASLSAAATAGKAVFNTQQCATCHGGAGFTLSGNGTQLKNIGTIKASSGNRLGATLTGLDIPTLRDVWSTGPYLHDGSAATLPAAITAHTGATITAGDLTNLVEYLRQIGNEEPAPAGSSTSVSFSGVANVYAMFNDGTVPINGGFDGGGWAYSANVMPNPVSALGVTFPLGAAGVANAVSNVTVPLPAGNFTTLRFVAAGANGNQPNQSFLVTYTDGTTATFSQSISDWFTPQNYSGETRAVTMARRINPNGTADNRTFLLYAYQFTLNSAKQVRSIKLPNNRGVIVLGINLQ